MKRNQLLISTIASDTKEVAKEYGLGIEIAEFCTAYNMDINFNEMDMQVKDEMSVSSIFTFHAPLNELCPAAIDPLIKEVAFKRYIQAFKLAKSYGINKIIIHSGFIPRIYFEEYFVEQSILFYKKLLNEVDDDLIICLENVMEENPYMLLDIVNGVNDKRFGLCLDIGHTHAVNSPYSIVEWVNIYKEKIYHYHIHDNLGGKDTHSPLGTGNIDLKSFFESADLYTKDATYTIENMHAKESVEYLLNNGILED